MIHRSADGRSFAMLFSKHHDPERLHIGVPSPRFNGRYAWLCCDMHSHRNRITSAGSDVQQRPVCVRCARKALALGLIQPWR